MLQSVSVTPYQAWVPRDPEAIFTEKVHDELQKAKAGIIRQVRQTSIKKADVDAYGHTPGCPRCDHALRYGWGRTKRQHSTACRERIYAEMLNSEQGRLRIARMGQRQLEFMTEYQSILERQQALRAKGEDKGVGAEPPPLQNACRCHRGAWGCRTVRAT